MTRPTCATCIWFDRGAPELATGTRRVTGSDADLGTCNHFPPELVRTRFFTETMRPETHARRVACILHDDGSDPDDGAREDVPATNVVPFDGKAAA